MCKSYLANRDALLSFDSPLVLIDSLTLNLTPNPTLSLTLHLTYSLRFAKTEEYGFSVMDIGAASFLLLNAVVDVRPSHCFR